MKRILPILLLLLVIKVQSQSYNNEWIDYSKTYYKFNIGSTGLYRINQATLSSIGLSSVNADFFQLWRNGVQVPIYTSVQSAPLGAGGYIEFWGEMNDGKADLPLYRQPDYQMNDKWSLQTDTAAYFLTVNSSGVNRRLTTVANNVAGNILTPEPFFMHTLGSYYRNKINTGRSELVGSSYTYSSSYDSGEGWTSSDIGTNGVLSFNSANLFSYTGAGAPDPSLRVNAAGNAVLPRYFKVTLNTDSVGGSEMNYYDYVKLTVPLTPSQLSSNVANISITNKCITAGDRMVVAQIELKYARQFNFGGASNFYFELPANANGNYLEIAGFNYGGPDKPVLYDLTNGARYEADITNPSLLKIALQPSAVDRKLVLVNEAASNILNVATIAQRNFINYGLAANQGDYLIITHSIFTSASGPGDPVEDYKAYRNSVAGGSYKTKVYLIDQLMDQFAYGIKMHPLSIRNFVRWARVNYSSPLKNVLLIGKGVSYPTYRGSESSGDPATKDALNKLALIPTFGYPASDKLLTAVGGSSLPLTPIGRLSVIYKNEISDYLEKVKEYEQELLTQSPTISDMSWKKDVVHVVGASDDITSDILLTALNGHKKIIEDTLYGAKVATFSKVTSQSVQTLKSINLEAMMNNGIGMLTYFGHSSSTTLEFNLDDPQSYKNQGKYPVFVVMGCNAGDFFTFNNARMTVKETLSEKSLLAKQRGSIAFLASTHLGIVHYLDIYNTNFYRELSSSEYGNTLGELMDVAIQKVFAITSENDFYARFQCEQFTLHGDPAIRLNAKPKPDYSIEDPLVKVSPSFISVAEKNFQVNASFMNIGKAASDSVVVELKRTYPNNSIKITRDTLARIRYIDSLTYFLPIDPISDKGLNRIAITIDPDNKIDELYETNNTITKDIYIFEDEVRPVFPYDFSIVNQPNPKLIASTANSFAESRRYVMEVDTTELFNSSFKISRNLTSAGGVIEFATDGITFRDSTVYYWRVSPDVPNVSPKWNVSSFIYISNSSRGYNQSHLFQHFKSLPERLILDSTNRNWSYKLVNNNIFARNGVFPNTSGQTNYYSGTINDQSGFIGAGCSYNELIMTVIDPVTLKAWKNQYAGGVGLYQSYPATCGSGREYNFEYLIGDATWRKKAMDFIDAIPDGYFVLVRTNTNPATSGNTYPSVWKTDESLWGTGNTLYHKLYNQGFTDLDSFYFPRAGIFLFKKNDPAFTAKSSFSQGLYDGTILSANFTSTDTLGFVTSPVFGPSKAWHDFKWAGKGDDPVNDIASVDIIGVTSVGNETVLYTGVTAPTLDISSVPATTYPYIKMKLKTMDRVKLTPYQLRYWMLTYDPVPEGAIAPNLYKAIKDTVEAGEPYNFGVGFKNISDVDFDSVKVKFTITDKNNVDKVFYSKQKPLQVGDTIKFNIPVDTKALSGLNTVFVNFNPDNDQPEHHLFNNYAFTPLYVKPDSLGPLLDVTFDGAHILNNDIVSSRPGIVIKLKDEAKWMILNDTSLTSITVRFPDNSLHRAYFANNSDTLQFIPVGQAPSTDNTATVNYKPYFYQDGNYELIVTAKDRSDNSAGTASYRVAFQVINKPMISNMLNYPNPFTTSTAFVFTLTGSEVPQNIRIQVLTITGKIIREIKKEELGPLRIGRNITEFKWDGTDQYGDKLANGIYLYRVITNLNGKSLDKYKAKDDNTDKFFNNGYGKMYLMR